jgi:lipid-binding SYLF domain-containing protein
LHSYNWQEQELKPMKPTKHILIPLILVAVTLVTSGSAFAGDLTSESRHALQQLVAQNPAAAKCKSKALAVLVFPSVVKAGFVIGAQEGEGMLFVHGTPSGRYRTVAASYGLQAGVQNTVTLCF